VSDVSDDIVSAVSEVSDVSLYGLHRDTNRIITKLLDPGNLDAFISKNKKNSHSKHIENVKSTVSNIKCGIFLEINIT